MFNSLKSKQIRKKLFKKNLIIFGKIKIVSFVRKIEIFYLIRKKKNHPPQSAVGNVTKRLSPRRHARFFFLLIHQI